MSLIRVGVDIGATKTALRVDDGSAVRDHVVSSAGWDAEPIASGIAWVDRVVRQTIAMPASDVILALGAQGLDNDELRRDFETQLQRLGYAAVACRNDAALLVPAAGLDVGIGLIAGTGAIGVGESADGATLFAGGWGAIIGDDAGAAGIVREATIAALSAHDDGEADDGLLSALIAAFGVADAERLARSVNDDPRPEHWAPHAHAVFAAAAAGSALAAGVIRHAALHLATLVRQLRVRGAVGTHIVAAGGVIRRQIGLQDELRSLLAEQDAALTLHVLEDEPVAGALRIARSL